MRITSPLPQKAYLTAMKDQMDGHFNFGTERFTGFFLGSCFYVTHHSGYEWNRKYTNQKNAAMGYVRKAEEGCEVRFIRFRGLLCPSQFLLEVLLLVLCWISIMLAEGIWIPNAFLIGLGISFAVTTISAPIATLFESLTERSEEGRRILLAFLLDPTDPFSYLNNKNRIP